MSLEFFDDADGPWDRLQLGPQNLPGIWEISGAGCARNFDEKKSPGKDGARIHDRGAMLARFIATGIIGTAEEQEEMEQILPTLIPKKKGGTATVLSVYHPAIAMLGITTVKVNRISPPKIVAEGLQFVIELVEWTAAPKATKTKESPAPMVEDIGIRGPHQDALDFLGTNNTVEPNGGFVFG